MRKSGKETKRTLTKSKKQCHVFTSTKITADATSFSYVREHPMYTYIKRDESSIAIFFYGGTQDVSAQTQ